MKIKAGQSSLPKYRYTSLYELKASYQKNILTANLIVTTIFVIVALLASLAGRANGPAGIMSSRHQESPPAPDRMESAGCPASIAAAHDARGNENRMSGFGVKYRIIPDVVPAPVSLSPNYTPGNMVPDGLGAAPDMSGMNGPRSGVTYDSPYEDGLPDNEVSWYLTFGLRYPNYTDHLQDIRKKENKVAEIRFTEPMRIPRKTETMSWTVVVSFDITEKGQLKNFEIVEENPPHLGLARALINQVQQCQVWPAEKGGEKVTTRVTLTRTNSCQSMPTEVRSNGGVVVVP